MRSRSTFTPPEVTPLCSQMWCLRHTSLTPRGLTKGDRNRPAIERSVPTFAVEYNYFMGGVDIHDQLRSYNPTQLTVRRN